MTKRHIAARWTAVGASVRRFARGHLRTRVTLAAYRSRVVRESLRFSLREWRGSSGAPAVYRLRECPGRVVVRHRTRDIGVLHELLLAHAYDPPPEAAAALADLATPHIADLGANIGVFGVRALALWPESFITAVEPDPDNAALLRRCVIRNQADDRWRVVEAFAGTEDGVARFVGGAQSYSRAATASELTGVIEVRKVDAFPLLARAQLVKIDIEGSEWALLEDPRWAALRPRGVILEYHGRLGADTHTIARRALEACELECREQLRDESLGLGILWGWRAP